MLLKEVNEQPEWVAHKHSLLIYVGLLTKANEVRV